MKKEPEKEKIIERAEGAGVVSRSIVTEMKESYLDYAMSVITARALPDVRDGLKPVHRRILFAMHEMGLTSSAKFRKSATVVGEVLGNYHPHGDAAVYDSMVKLAQDFSTRYPLVIGQGNFGSVDGDQAAAYRYTEAKMSKLSGEILRDIEKDTVDFRPNYDGRKMEPTVMPSTVPNLLLNGTLGIAVGMATNIPPHNIKEVAEAVSYFVDNGDASTEDLMQFIKGPDFPTGGIAYSESDIHHAYTTGRGGVVVRGVAEIVESKLNQFQIIITEIPYRVNKSVLIENIANLIHEKKIEGIRDMRDESTKDIRIVIELKSGSQPQKVLNSLYKHTQLEEAFHYNLVAIVDGVPQTLALSDIIGEFVKHRKIVIKRRTEFDLMKAKDREHILLGLKKALDHIDKIIALIRKSKDVETAKLALMKEFKFSEKQAVAILEMRLQKLAGLERQKVEDELKEVQALIAELESILASSKKVSAIIKKDMEDVIATYGDDRRTKLVKHAAKSFSVEDLVAEEEQTLVLTAGGYVKRTKPEEYRKQKRGGVGVIDLDTKEEDFVTNILSASTHSDLLFFSDKGKAYQLKMFELPEGKRATKGKSIVNYLAISEDERITSILPVPKETKAQEDTSLLMVTKGGIGKRVSAASFADVRSSGIIAIKLDNGDKLQSVSISRKGDTAILATSEGQSIHFSENDVREMGRTAGGVRLIHLKAKDFVVGARVIPKADKERAQLLTVAQNGYGKKTPLDEYKVQKRGGSGIKTAQVTAKTGKVMSASIVLSDEEELVTISKKGQIIRVGTDEIPSLGRQTQGVRIMKLREGDSLASAVCL
ncbi:MAG: DNA gyrase subunit A [Minisyncoccia bacterium]